MIQKCSHYSYGVAYECLYGTICSGWKRDSKIIEYNVEVPVNTVADVRIEIPQSGIMGVSVKKEDIFYEI